MSSCGIYTLANDVVYDQLVAFLNSVEVNVSPETPVCIIPYNDRLEKVKKEVDSRPSVTLYEDRQELQRWEEFARDVWKAHPQGSQKRFASLVESKVKLQRKMVAFNGLFEKFVFYDTDVLAMKPLDDVFAKLDTYDFVFDDWEPAKKRLTALNIDLIEATGEFGESEIRPRLHCSSFFGSKRGLFSEEEVEEIKKRLIRDGEVKWINGIADAFMFSYLTLRGDRPIFNYTLSPNGQERTGNCADADPFVNVDNVLYNQEGLKPIYRIHYMNFSSQLFARLSQGEAVDIPHRDVFLHYRFLKQPDLKPKTLTPASIPVKIQRKVQDGIKKIKKIVPSML